MTFTHHRSRRDRGCRGGVCIQQDDVICVAVKAEDSHSGLTIDTTLVISLSEPVVAEQSPEKVCEVLISF